MKNLNRRNFLKSSVLGVAAASIGSDATASSSNNTSILQQLQQEAIQPELKIAFQERIPPGKNLKEKFDFMEQHGVVGFEPNGNGLLERVPQLQKELRGRAIEVSAVCAGFDGFILSSDTEIRKQFNDTIRDIIRAAGILESCGVIFVPVFNHQTPALPHTADTRNFLCEEINKLGNFAYENGTTVILEPLNRKEAFYLRQVADAASICRDINNKGVRCMGDFWHMTFEENSDYGAFLSAGDYLQHVHIASRKCRSMPGEDGEADNYVEGFRALKEMGYNKHISFECGCQGDREKVVVEALNLMRQQWEI